MTMSINIGVWYSHRLTQHWGKVGARVEKPHGHCHHIFPNLSSVETVGTLALTVHGIGNVANPNRYDMFL